MSYRFFSFDNKIIFDLLIKAKHHHQSRSYYSYCYIRVSIGEHLIFRNSIDAHRHIRVDSIAVSRKQVHRFIIYRRYSGHLIKNILRAIPLSV